VAYRGRVYLHVFIGVSARALCVFALYCVILKKVIKILIQIFLKTTLLYIYFLKHTHQLGKRANEK
jgi:hypothetical protein